MNPLESDPVSWRAQYQDANYAERLFRQKLPWLMTILKQARAKSAGFLDVPVDMTGAPSAIVTRSGCDIDYSSSFLNNVSKSGLSVKVAFSDFCNKMFL